MATTAAAQIRLVAPAAPPCVATGRPGLKFRDSRRLAADRHAARGLRVNATTESKVLLSVQDLTPESFAPFGQVCSAQKDGKAFDLDDAQLVLDKGTPRFYIMRLPEKGTSFSRITYHSKVTQCLGGLSPEPWYMAVAAPSGSVQAFPDKEDLSVFRVPPGTFIKLHEGTWHAGPLFAGVPHMDFYNLELSDTNVVDHNTHVYQDRQFLLDL